MSGGVQFTAQDMQSPIRRKSQLLSISIILVLALIIAAIVVM